MMDHGFHMKELGNISMAYKTWSPFSGVGKATVGSSHSESMAFWKQAAWEKGNVLNLRLMLHHKIVKKGITTASTSRS
jgi:hypothetical protein